MWWHYIRNVGCTFTVTNKRLSFDKQYSKADITYKSRLCEKPTRPEPTKPLLFWVMLFYVFLDHRSSQIRYAAFSFSMVVAMRLIVDVGLDHPHFSILLLRVTIVTLCLFVPRNTWCGNAWFEGQVSLKSTKIFTQSCDNTQCLPQYSSQPETYRKLWV